MDALEQRYIDWQEAQNKGCSERQAENQKQTDKDKADILEAVKILKGVSLLWTNGYVYEFQSIDRKFKLCNQMSRVVGDSYLYGHDQYLITMADDHFLAHDNFDLYKQASDKVDKRGYCENGNFVSTVVAILTGHVQGRNAQEQYGYMNDDLEHIRRRM